ncbi:amino acid ABC transporter permease [Aminobacter carboxidus]|uniref:Glutamate/aspartate import permease protein GltK n=1 Tax=Aminobacter carboxidus TaxID=376165 RepID=A0A8E1WKH9_9HYPH|nr:MULTISPECIES: amino acid ABC transporter permease [Aminobacter carboxidus group]MBB6470193.1 polar amino acid transport system permease protein [Aminobacter lissarensis]MBE1205085.1 amino acid ABC transporter permease [Aminobacter carboxidus]
MDRADTHTPPPEALTVVPLRHYGLWVGTAITLAILGLIFKALATNPAFDWPTVGKYLFHPSIIRGLGQTLVLTVTIMVLAIIIGTIVAIMRLSPSRILNAFASAYIWFFRGAPALIQLIFWFNLALIVREFSLTLPFIGTVFTVKTNDFMTPFVAAVVALSLHEAGYMAEIVRAGINSVASGQTEAAGSLGMNHRLILRRITLPQAMRFIVPPTGNETINLLKTTSLVTIIAVNDLLYAAQSIYARTFETIPLLIVVAFWYLFVVTILSIGQHYIEQYYGRSDQQQGVSLRETLKRAFRFGRVAQPA